MSVCHKPTILFALNLTCESNKNFIYAKRRQGSFCKSLNLLLNGALFFLLNNIRSKKPTAHAHLNRSLGPYIEDMFRSSGFVQIAIKEKQNTIFVQ